MPEHVQATHVSFSWRVDVYLVPFVEDEHTVFLKRSSRAEGDEGVPR
jgi:hypothetical protein